MPYFLSTVLECSICAGPMHATKRTGRRAQPRHYYVCTTHRVRGDRLCTNWASAPMERLDTAVVDAFTKKVFTDDLVDDIIERVTELREAKRAARTSERPRLDSELRRVEAELGRYAEAIASSGPLPSILEAIRCRERRREEIQEQLRRTENAGGHQKGPQELRRAIEKRIADWRGLFHRHLEQARETVLRPLLGGRRLVLTPTITADGRLYAFEQKLSYGALIAGLIGAGDARVMTVVPPG